MATKKGSDDWDKWNARLKDLGLYFFGLFIAYNEFIIQKDDVRWPAVVFIASVLSIPSVIKIDEALRKRTGNEQTEENK